MKFCRGFRLQYPLITYFHRMENGFDGNGRLPPPRGLGEVEDQADSAACVRFGLSKAIANALFVLNKIDVEQSHITMCIVQALNGYSPLTPISPLVLDGIKLYLQDKGNKNTSHPIKNKAWWKVLHIHIWNA